MMMEQVLEKKLNVTRQLEKETSQVVTLKDILSRSGQVATNVSGILDSFEHRLARLETTILPLYQQTGNLQRRQRNTEKTLQELDYVISFYNVAGQVEGTVRERPSSVGVPQYLEAMNRLAEACRYFEQNNPQSVEIENVTTLFEAGTDALSKEFRDELKKYQKPVPPVVTLELLDEEELSEDTIIQRGKLVPRGAKDPEGHCHLAFRQRLTLTALPVPVLSPHPPSPLSDTPDIAQGTTASRFAQLDLGPPLNRALNDRSRPRPQLHGLPSLAHRWNLINRAQPASFPVTGGVVLDRHHFPKSRTQKISQQSQNPTASQRGRHSKVNSVHADKGSPGHTCTPAWQPFTPPDELALRSLPQELLS
ncbi:Exocyst complex component 7 [Penaeus vannamei]|uniref:Exocyst complex component 7 n=1 Tax=Penaeus vannamei TaxID=6689 RepID=A0A3R7N894_PENVA|nr:Exocyst complex component 7 [Penaeus vannamei]